MSTAEYSGAALKLVKVYLSLFLLLTEIFFIFQAHSRELVADPQRHGQWE